MPVFFAAFFAALVATPLMRALAVRNGIVDWPDLKRKNHLQPVAYLGGVAIFVGWLAGVALCYAQLPSMGPVGFPLAIVLGAGVITLTGLFDDVYAISPRVKVGGQLIAAAALAHQHVGLHLCESAMHLLGLEAPFWVVYGLGTVAIAVFVLGGCNSVNLIDGLDGLAAGVTAIAFAGFLVMAGLVAEDPYWSPVRIVMGLAALGAVLGFLPYNFNPATIFMGDAGALLLGYLSVAMILLFAETDTSQGMKLVTAALIIFALPIADTTLAIVRRTLRGQSIFAPDNEHIHHLLRRSGLGARRSVLTLYSVAVTLAALGCTLVWLEVRWRYLLAVFAVLYTFVLVTSYKYAQWRRALDQIQSQTDPGVPLATVTDLRTRPEASAEQASESDLSTGSRGV